VTRKLSHSLNCEDCLSFLFGSEENLIGSFLDFKNRGGLSYPSDDVIAVCVKSEKLLKLQINTNVKVDKSRIVYDVLKYFSTKLLAYYRHLHYYILVKSVANVYLDLRIKFACQVF
jgi:hypothetical protein